MFEPGAKKSFIAFAVHSLLQVASVRVIWVAAHWMSARQVQVSAKKTGLGHAAATSDVRVRRGFG
jgi:hypothetical protein